MENSDCFPLGKPAATVSRYPIYSAYWVLQCFHSPPNSYMNYRIFNVRTDVNKCDCTWGCTDTRKRVCTEGWLWEKNPLPHRGIEPASAAWRPDALTDWATSPSHLTRKCHRLYQTIFFFNRSHQKCRRQGVALTERVLATRQTDQGRTEQNPVHIER